MSKTCPEAKDYEVCVEDGKKYIKVPVQETKEVDNKEKNACDTKKYDNKKIYVPSSRMPEFSTSPLSLKEPLRTCDAYCQSCEICEVELCRKPSYVEQRCSISDVSKIRTYEQQLRDREHMQYRRSSKRLGDRTCFQKKRPLAKKGRKTNAGTQVLLILTLKKLQEQGISYKIVNRYFMEEFEGLERMNMYENGYIAGILTYDPRYDEVKTYESVLQKIGDAPAKLNWVFMFDIVDGLSMD